MYVVYVIFNEERDKIYIGYTTNLTERLKRHNQIIPSKKSSFTYKNSGRWKVAYQESFSTKKEAMKREREMKSSRGRAFIRGLIKK